MFRLIKKIKDKGRWRIFKLKLIDARLYFVSIFVGLLTGLVAVPYHYLLQFFFNLRHDFFDSHPKWYWYIPLFLLMWGILVFVSWLVKKMPLITGGGIPQTRGVINGRVDYKHPFLELVAKFVGGILALSTGLSLGREGPSVQIGSYIGYLVSKWGRVLSGERKQLLSAGAGAGLAAAFAAPLASSLLVIESIERFDAPKTAITTLLAGVVAGGVASWIFPINPYFHIDAIVPGMTFWGQVKLFLLLAAVVSVFGKFFSVTTLQVKRIYPAIKHPEYVKMLYLLFIAFLISMAEFNLTGGGEQFLLSQAMHPDTHILWIVGMMLLHFVFSAFSFSSGLPGGSFIPTLVTGGLLGQIVGLIMVQQGVIAYENISYIMLICMSAFLVAVIRTPLTAIVLITEITGHLEVFYPSIVVGGLTYYFTEMLQIKPFNVILYDDMIHSPAFKEEPRYTLSAFLVAVIRTPLTAIVLITEITGHLEVFYPSIVVGGLTYYFTEMLQIKPFNVILYDDMIHSPAFKEEPRYTLSVEIMSGSYLDGKIVDELRLPERCVIINVHRDRKNLPPKGQTLMPGDQVQIEMDSQDIEKLYEPLVSMANIY